MVFDIPVFVVERRINRPLADIQRGLADRTPLAAAGILDLESDGFLCLHEPLRPARPYSSSQPVPTWYAAGHLLAERRRTIAAVEISVSMWSHDATALTLRPVAVHPERWGNWRLRKYFALAHLAADATCRVIAQRAALAVEAYRNEPAFIERDAARDAFSRR
jgi:hypothetical protein